MSYQINLYNPALLKQVVPFSAWLMLQGMVLLIFLCILVTAYIKYPLSALETQVQITEEKLNRVRNQLIDMSATLKQKTVSTLLEEELTRFESRLNAKKLIIEILGKDTLGNTTGYSEYMRAFSRQLLNGLRLTGFVISNTEMVLTGRLIKPELIPAFLQRLKHERVMQGRSFSNLQINMPEPEKLVDLEESTMVTPDYLEFSLRSSGSEEK
jgi:hypothetical protein